MVEVGKDELKKWQQHASMISLVMQAIEASEHITGHDSSTLGNILHPAHPRGILGGVHWQVLMHSWPHYRPDSAAQP